MGSYKEGWGLPVAAEVGVIAALGADGGLAAVTGVDDGAVGQGHQPLPYTLQQLAAGAARHEGGADAAAEEGVPGKDPAFGKQADAAGGMAGGVQHGEAGIADGYFIAFAEEVVGGAGGGIGDAELRAVGPAPFQEIGVLDVDGRLGPGGLLDVVEGGDVVGVAVGEDDGPDGQAGIGDGLFYGGGVAAGVDDQALPRFPGADYIAVGR